MNLTALMTAAHCRPLSARDARIVDNMPLILHVCRRCRVRVTDDVLQAGMVGLIRAVDEHKPECGALSTFAFHCIRNAIWVQEGKTWRRSKREKLLPVEEMAQIGPVYTDLDGIERAQINEALDAMLPQDRELVAANYLGGETQQSIATRYGVRKQAVNQRIVRGIRAAQKRLHAA